VRRGSVVDAAALLGGFVLWSIAFAAFYGAHGLLCSMDLAGGFERRLVLVALFVAAMLAHVGFAWWVAARGRTRPGAAAGLDRIALALALAALAATLWSGLPVIVLKSC